MKRLSGNTIFPAGIITLLWVSAALYVNPEGEFPLNDDWSYTLPVKSFIEKNEFNFTAWPMMSLIGHTLLGIVWTQCTGFSFTSLRILELVLGGTGILITFAILRRLQPSAFIACMFSLVIAFNPIYFSLSYTYMTDISFYAFAALALYCYIRELEAPATGVYILATACSVFAILIRQPAIVLPLAFGIVVLLMHKRKRPVYALLPFVLTALVFCVYEFYLKYELGYSRLFPNKNILYLKTLSEKPVRTLQWEIYVLLQVFLNTGLFLIPLSAFVIPRIQLFKKYAALSVFGAGFISVACTFLLHHWNPNTLKNTLPFGNILNDSYIGPSLLYDATILKVHPHPSYPLLWSLLNIVSFASSLCLLCFICEQAWSYHKRKKTGQYRIFLYSILCIVLYIPLVSFLSFFDRYTLPVLLFTLIAVFSTEEVRHTASVLKPVVIACTIIAALFSVTETRTYLNWNRARWEAANHLVYEKKISPVQIDGGFEFNGWYNYTSAYKTEEAKKRRHKSWWWVYEDDYVLSFIPLKGYEVIKTYRYEKDMWGNQGSIVINRKVIH